MFINLRGTVTLMLTSHKIQKSMSLEEQVARARLPGNTVIEQKINKRIIEQFPEGIPFISERFSRSRENTLKFGGNLRDRMRGEKGGRPSVWANDYVFDIEEGQPFDRSSQEYQRSLIICSETIDAFVKHRKQETKKFMAFAEEERLPMVTHSFLVAHRLKYLAVPEGYYREMLRAAMLLHDVKEDTDKNVRKILEKAIREHPFADKAASKRYVADVIAVNGLLTRRETFYVRDIQHVLDGKNQNNTTMSLERILLAAIVKEEDRHVNTRSLEPFDLFKQAREVMKSLWVADYLGKELVQRYGDPKNIPGGEDPATVMMLVSVLRTAIQDNLRSLYGVLKAATLKAEDALREYKGGEELMKQVQESVYGHIDKGGLKELSQPGRQEDRSDPDSLDGLILLFSSSLYPKEEDLRKAYKKKGGKPDRMNEYVDEQKKRILANTPGIVQPEVFRKRLTRTPNRDGYDKIMEWNEELNARLKDPVQTYRMFFGLYKVVQHHLDLEAGGEKYHLLRPGRKQ